MAQLALESPHSGSQPAILGTCRIRGTSAPPHTVFFCSMSSHDYILSAFERDYDRGLISDEEYFETVGYPDPNEIFVAWIEHCNQQEQEEEEALAATDTDQIFLDVEAAYLRGSITRDGALDCFETFGHPDPDARIAKLDQEIQQ